MRKNIYLIIGVVLFSSCAVHKNLISNREARQNNKQIQKDHRESIDGYTPVTSLQYIERYKAIAVKEMNTYGVPASITIAQGLYESGSGNSELARVANNHFGIKCTPDWKGKGYYKDDDQANDCFRVYENPEESFRDHSIFLKRRNYTPLFDLDITDYKGWARGLKKAGYATNPDYPNQLITIIEKYHLDQYDAAPDTYAQKSKKQDVVVPDTTEKIAVAAKDSTVVAALPDKMYMVKQGDTLYNISKRFGLTVDDLKTLNNLDGNNIKIGQKLVVVK